MVAFAVTQSKLGRLDPDIRDWAVAVLDGGGDLDVWESENPKLLSKRRAVLEKARFTYWLLSRRGNACARRSGRSPGLAAGDVLAFPLPGRIALLRVVRVRSHRLGEAPVLQGGGFSTARRSLP